ncbi:HTTM domain-containing protein [Haladaptatus sp. F3-133]|uniref:HTTM domain-containing protein n=1 Tax=Halorutilus salinus TaxID=2487751 RepID=A0A9Q4C385_9EURY|nr:HTTM domain-containing protein [Halorutilus salinus]MCX2819042.1 HTTM domain-containing protein [Halorutilus salinus]
MGAPSFADVREKVGAGLRRRFGVDTRSLAAFRICLGVAVLVNLVARTRDLTAFYTRNGAVPLAAVQEHTTLSAFSVYAVSDSWLYVVFLFVLTAVFAVALIVGYRTRFVSVVVLVLVFSLNARNPLVMNGGDTLLTRLVFWGALLPLGARWSVDAVGRGEKGDGAYGRVASVATVGVLVQVVVVYATNAVFKLRSDAWMSGDAVLQVFELSAYTTWLGSSLTRFAELLVLLNHLWVALLVASPLLILLTGRRRAFVLTLFVGAQAGLLVTMNLAVFPLVAVAGLAVLTPSVVWEVARRRLPSVHGTGATLLRRTDGVLPDVRRTGLPLQSGWGRRAVSAFAAVCLVVVLMTNASAMGYVDTPDEAEAVEEYAGTKWSLFAPYPPTTDRWYVARGVTPSGEKFDPLHLAPFERDRRPDSYPNARWRKYLDSVRSSGDVYLERPLLRYLCGRTEGREDELENVTLLYVSYDDGIQTERMARGSCE